MPRVGGVHGGEDQQKPGAAQRRNAGQVKSVGHEQRQTGGDQHSFHRLTPDFPLQEGRQFAVAAIQ